MAAPTRNHKSLAVLLCGKTSGKTRAENGDYIDIYKRFLQDSLDSHTAVLSPTQKNASNLENPSNNNDNSDAQPVWQFTLDSYDVFEAQEFPTDEKLDDYDGIIITGSPSSAYDNMDWINKLVALTKRVVETKPKIKLIGICFGHQIIARALGGECVPNTQGWEVGPTNIDLTDLGKQIFGGLDTITLEEMHRDHVPVDRTPPSFHLLGSTERSGNQGMVKFYDEADVPPPSVTPATVPNTTTSNVNPENPAIANTQPSTFEANTQSPPLTPDLVSNRELLKKVQVFTVQGHPEWNEKVVTPLVEERRGKVIPEDIADQAMERRFWRNDGVSVVGSIVWSILGV